MSPNDAENGLLEASQYAEYAERCLDEGYVMTFLITRAGQPVTPQPVLADLAFLSRCKRAIMLLPRLRCIETRTCFLTEARVGSRDLSRVALCRCDGASRCC